MQAETQVSGYEKSKKKRAQKQGRSVDLTGSRCWQPGLSFTARTEILDLVTTEIAFVLIRNRKAERKNLTRILVERVESTDGGKKR
ncbi:MAG: hypothetical protein ACLR78_05630 [Roseburia sp.]